MESFRSAPWLILGLVLLAQPTRGRAADAPALTNVAQVKSLAPSEAAKRLPVRLRGFVTYLHTGSYAMFLLDAMAGIYLAPGEPQYHARIAIRPGQWVEVEGRTEAGSFAPIISGVEPGHPPRFTILGRTNPPPAIRVTADVTAPMSLENGWVEAQGIVRRVGFTDPPAAIALKGQEAGSLALAGRRVSLDARLAAGAPVEGGYGITLDRGLESVDALAFRAIDRPLLERIPVGATLRVEGIFEPRLSDSLQYQGFRLLLPDATSVGVMDRPSWWTPRRLAILAGTLFCILFGAGVVAAQLARKHRALRIELGGKLDHPMSRPLDDPDSLPIFPASSCPRVDAHDVRTESKTRKQRYEPIHDCRKSSSRSRRGSGGDGQSQT